MFDIAPYFTATAVSLLVTVTVIVPIVWVGAFNTGPRGKTVRKVLSMILRNRPPG